MGLSENQSLSYAFIPRLEDLLNVNIYVVSSALGNAFSYISQNHDQERKKIFLYHVEKESGEHFHAIVKIGGFFAHSNFCSSCLKPYEHQHRHHCKNHCRVCRTTVSSSNPMSARIATEPVDQLSVTRDTRVEPKTVLCHVI